MWPVRWIQSVWQSNSEMPTSAAANRDRAALLLALATLVCGGLVFFLSKDTQMLMPGPLSSAHGGIEKCSSCHTKSGSGKLTWTHGLVAGDPRADSKACITCHKMPDTALNAHGASLDVLKGSTERLTKIAGNSSVPQAAHAQSVAFPTRDMDASGLTCATCHQEHQGTDFKLSKISNEQCRSCHVVKFDSFDSDHPKFENYPFKKRTAIVYDHAGHFDKHYPELAKKEPAKRIPATCSTCHTSSGDKRIMAVVPFEKTCATCHLDQITGKERASGPKGIAFLSMPGLDLETLRKKNAAMGEWPDGSDAMLTPFMKVMVSRTERGRALLKTVSGLDLQNLSNASDDQLKAVTDLVWEIKALVHALILGKASDALGNLNLSGAKLSAGLVADLTASIPRDVLISAQQQWLPSLATEMANLKVAGDQAGSAWTNMMPVPATPSLATEPESASEKITEPESSEDKTDADAEEASAKESPSADGREAPKVTSRDPPPCMVRVLGQCLMFKEASDPPKAAVSGAEQAGAENTEPQSGEKSSAASTLPPPMRAGLQDAVKVAQAADATDPTNSNSPDSKPDGSKAKNQSDDLLFPTDAELRELKAVIKDAGRTDQPNASAATTGTSSNTPAAVPVISIDSGVDPESWAEYGGWYRQDHAIYYRPTGHKDKLVYAWLFLTGPQAPKGSTSPPAAVFDFLTGKDAQGSCTKCHSVDDLQGKGRVVNFSPLGVEGKRGRFTTFIHEPHFAIKEDRGCLACHTLEKGRPYLTSYEQGNPQSFAANFGDVKKDLCQICHTSTKARQDCLTCHKYHVNGVITPIMTTKIPEQ